MILTTPLLERLAARGAVDVVATPASAGLLANHPAVRDVIVYDKRGADAGVQGLRRVAARVRATGADTAYLAQGSLRTAALARLAGIPERIGFDTSPGRWLYTQRVRFRRTLHHADRLWLLATRAGIVEIPPALRPSLFPGAADYAAVDALLRANNVSPGAPLIALAPGSVWATKRWPWYDALARGMLRSPATRDARIVVLGAPGDKPLAQAIAAAVRETGGPDVVDATGMLSLLGSAALLTRVRVLITNDSAPLHLASAMNVPTVALFGPTVPDFGFGPLASRSEVLGHELLSCRPCGTHGPQKCPLGHWRCMRELAVDRVAHAVERIGVEA